MEDVHPAEDVVDIADEEEKALWHGMTEALDDVLLDSPESPQAPRPPPPPQSVPRKQSSSSSRTRMAPRLSWPASARSSGDATDLLDHPPEILVAYISGQPEAVAAIELLKEAQRVWNDRKKPEGNQRSQKRNLPHQGSILGTSPEELDAVRRFSHDDICMVYANFFSGNRTAIPVHFRRRPSSQAESLSGSSVVRRYQKHRMPSKAGQPVRIRNADAAASMHLPSTESSLPPQRRNSLGVAAYHAESSAASRRASQHRSSTDVDVHLPLGAEASSFQRRRLSRASAIFLVSPSGKEKRLVPEPEEGTPGERRRRRTISIIATVGAFLLVISILLVTITLRLATHIDDMGKYFRSVSNPTLSIGRSI